MREKTSSDLIKLTIAMMDLALITVAFYLSYWLRFDSWKNVELYTWLYYFSAPLILFLLLRHGVLTGFRYQSLRQIFKSTIIAFVVAGVVSSTVLYLSKTGDYSRLLFGNYFVFAVIFVLAEKVIVKQLFDRHLRRGGMNIRVALVGFGQKFDEIIAEISDRPQWGIAPVLVLNPQGFDVAEVAAKVRRAVVDEAYISYPRGAVYHEQIDGLLERLERLGLPVRVALNFDELQDYYGQHICTMGSKPGVMLAPHNLDPDQLIIKRVMDLAGGFIGVLITGLLFPFVALAIKLESPGSIFFSHTRVGKGGRNFDIYKFRSMYRDAEQRKQELMGENIHTGPLFKVDNDPRITRVGHIIRKYSLDEFPQFWNVLKGDMSLVGTRPPTREEVDEYEDHHFKRISIKPGLTGLWQVSGRNKVTEFEEVVMLDIKYIKNWNLWLDIKIILRTIGVVLAPGRSGGL